jgi:hypothetical protein
MTYPRSKHVALLDIGTLISKYSCIMSDTNFMYFIIITQWGVTYKDSVGSGENTSSLPLRNVLLFSLAFGGL